MRIVLTTHVFYPEQGGGVARYAETLGQTLRERGHDVGLLTAGSRQSGEQPGTRAVDDEWHGLPVRRLFFNLALAPNPLRAEWDNPWVNERVLEYVAERDAELVHFVHGGHLSMSAIPLLKERGLALIGSVLDFWNVCPLSTLRRPSGALCQGPDDLGAECVRCLSALQPPRKYPQSVPLRYAPYPALRALVQVSRTLGRDAGKWGWLNAVSHRLEAMREYVGALDVALCPSEFVASLLRQNGFATRNLRVLPLGVRPPDPPPPPRPRHSGPLRVGFLGRLEPAKGAHVLIEAVLASPHLPLEVHVYGNDADPAYAARLRALAAPDPRVSFGGEVPQPYAALRGLDVLAVPSIWYEGAPLAIRDAQALGLPVLASNLGGVAEAVRDDVDGLTFRPGDPADLARNLRRLTTEAGLLDRLAAGVRPPMSIDQHADQILEIYAESCATALHRPGSIDRTRNPIRP
jgi:glycosyltransferase involved in cell wall biosynthesis